MLSKGVGGVLAEAKVLICYSNAVRMMKMA